MKKFTILTHIIKMLLGSHTSFERSIYKTVCSSINQGMYASQFFLGSPQSFQRFHPTEKDIADTQALLNRFPMSIFTHYPYVANLAGSKDALAWSNNTEQDTKTTNILKQLQHELDTMAHFENSGVVIHPGNYTDRNKGLHAISQSINKLEFKPNSCLLLENSAGQGTSLATTLEEIKLILEGVDTCKKPHIGVCLDTCHIHAYGDYDLTQNGEVDRLLYDFQHSIGLEKLKLLHLNDSLHPRKSRKDRHERIGQGTIWKRGKESLTYLLHKCNENQTPIVLETTPDDIQVVHKL